jgi:hypothetical protein
MQLAGWLAGWLAGCIITLAALSSGARGAEEPFVASMAQHGLSHSAEVISDRDLEVAVAEEGDPPFLLHMLTKSDATPH